MAQQDTNNSDVTVQTVVLVDLSSIAYPIYMTSASQPDPDHASQATVARVHALAADHEHVAVCCDSGRSFRRDIDPSYKANRPERDEVLIHQIRLAQEQLTADGFPVWKADGFEADDLIASATVQARQAGADVLIVTGDKDLLQLVDEHVNVKKSRDGEVLAPADVVNKFGVRPDQMRDYLSLVGDASDNVKGAVGIGEKKAADILSKFVSLDVFYAEHGNAVAVPGLQPSVIAALRDFKPRLNMTRALITLRTDAPVPFAEILNPRQVEMAMPEPDAEPVAEPVQNGNGHAQPDVQYVPEDAKALAVREPDVLAPALVEFERQLEPRSMREAQGLAENLFKARLFNGYGTPQSVLAVVLAGREMGLQAVASLRAFHIVDGKPTMAADLMRALVLRSGKAEYFRCTERTAERATFVTQRKGEPEMALTFTIEEGRVAWPKSEEAWDKSGWGHNPADMLVARAGAKLARLVYPDVVHGFYAPEELEA